MPHPRALSHSSAVLLVVDLQEAFRKAIADFAVVAANAARVVSGFAALGLPVFVTEQYPKGLGPTAEELALAFPPDVRVFEKAEFSAYQADGFAAALAETRRKQIVLCGIEAHVCVNQTAADLVDAGFDVHLLTDCVASRFDHDRRAALDKLFGIGVVPCSVEMCLFELMKTSKHPAFRDVQNLIK